MTSGSTAKTNDMPIVTVGSL